MQYYSKPFSFIYHKQNYNYLLHGCLCFSEITSRDSKECIPRTI